MIHLLLSVPGKLKAISDYLATNLASARMALIDNLTAVRVAKIDNLDTAVSTAFSPKRITSITTGSGTFTPLVDNARCYVRLQSSGGSGAGGQSAGPYHASGGGGAGAMLEFWIRVPIAGLAYVIPAAQTGGAANTDGNNGGAAQFGPIYAPGGKKGTSGVTTGAGGEGGLLGSFTTAGGVAGLNGVAGGGGGPYGSAGYGGAPGFSQAGTYGVPGGGPASPPVAARGGAGDTGGGGGGSSFFGVGGAGGSSGIGGNATGYGAGGGGSGTAVAAAAGGNSTGGCIEIWEYAP